LFTLIVAWSAMMAMLSLKIYGLIYWALCGCISPYSAAMLCTVLLSMLLPMSGCLLSMLLCSAHTCMLREDGGCLMLLLCLFSLSMFTSAFASGCAKVCMDCSNHQFKFMSWNVRGMNSGAIQEDIKQVTNIFKPDLICIQETKMEVINNTIIRSTLGYDYEGQFGYLPASGASGGILITVRDSVLHILNPTITSHTISVAIHDCRINKTWWFTEVYGPQGELEKKMFIHELRLKKMFIHELRLLEQAAPLEWLIMGDFNLTYNLEDKNNDRLDRRMMTRFRRALNFLELKEI
jgi:hypothetical protein